MDIKSICCLLFLLLSCMKVILANGIHTLSTKSPLKITSSPVIQLTNQTKLLVISTNSEIPNNHVTSTSFIVTYLNMINTSKSTPVIDKRTESSVSNQLDSSTSEATFKTFILSSTRTLLAHLPSTSNYDIVNSSSIKLSMSNLTRNLSSVQSIDTSNIKVALIHTTVSSNTVKAKLESSIFLSVSSSLGSMSKSSLLLSKGTEKSQHVTQSSARSSNSSSLTIKHVPSSSHRVSSKMTTMISSSTGALNHTKDSSERTIVSSPSSMYLSSIELNISKSIIYAPSTNILTSFENSKATKFILPLSSKNTGPSISITIGTKVYSKSIRIAPTSSKSTASGKSEISKSMLPEVSVSTSSIDAIYSISNHVALPTSTTTVQTKPPIVSISSSVPVPHVKEKTKPKQKRKGKDRSMIFVIVIVIFITIFLFIIVGAIYYKKKNNKFRRYRLYDDHIKIPGFTEYGGVVRLSEFNVDSPDEDGDDSNSNSNPISFEDEQYNMDNLPEPRSMLRFDV